MPTIPAIVDESRMQPNGSDPKQKRYTLIGSSGSPYSLKVRALLRYRRLPYIWVEGFLRGLDQARRHGLPPVIPLLQTPDGHWKNDSTKLILELEQDAPDWRSVIPNDELLAFVALLLEDMADEWLTKIMFGFRWTSERNADSVSQALAYDHWSGETKLDRKKIAADIRQRQIARLPMVGCTNESFPLFRQHFDTLLDILERQWSRSGGFILGDRPCIADFAIYGQLAQMALDPDSRDRMAERAPLVLRWLEHVDELSGLEASDSASATWQLTDAAKELLAFSASIYLPFLKANAAALNKQEAKLELRISGQLYRQAPFKYQQKCYRVLLQRFEGLSQESRQQIAPWFDPHLMELSPLN